jgi:hypothetical protein
MAYVSGRVQSWKVSFRLAIFYPGTSASQTNCWHGSNPTWDKKYLINGEHECRGEVNVVKVEGWQSCGIGWALEFLVGGNGGDLCKEGVRDSNIITVWILLFEAENMWLLLDGLT